MSDELVVGEVTSLEAKYKWEIKSYGAINVGTSKSICSPVFSTSQSHGKTLRWRLKLYPNGYNRDSKEYVSVYLQSLEKTKVSSKFSVAIINDAEAEVFQQCTQEKRTFRSRQDWGWPKFVQKQLIADATKCVLNNDKLIVSCSLFSTSVVSSDETKDSNDDDDDDDDEEEEDDEEDYDEDEVAEDHSSKMLSYFEKLFESGDFSDVTVVVEKKRLHLHKAILASLSPIFQATFQQELKESPAKEHVYEVSGIKYEIMKEMFRYIYTAKINHLDDIAADLLAAADRYSLEKLKLLCEKTLCDELTPDNALRLLELATRFHTTILKAKVTEMVVGRLSEFVARLEFKQLSSACKDELLSSIAVKRPNK